MIRSLPIQQAVYTVLVGDSTLMSKLNGVLDNPDQNTALPYITLGESTASPDDLLIEQGSQETVTLQIWDRGRGFYQVKEIMQEVYRVLHRRQLLIADTQFVECRCELAETLREGDGETRRGVMRFRILVFG